MAEDDVEAYLSKELKSAEKDLREAEKAVDPLRDRVRKLRASLVEYTAGSRGSQNLTDDAIVAVVKKHATKAAPLSSPEIAALLNVDTRGLSRRLPRMANDGMLSGGTKEGYYVDGRKGS